jgi:hypothetical protein
MKNEIARAIEKLRIAEDWGNGNICLMTEDEADQAHAEQLAATADHDNPDGWGEEPRELRDNDLVVWNRTDLAHCGSHIITPAAQRYVDALVIAAGELDQWTVSVGEVITLAHDINK